MSGIANILKSELERQLSEIAQLQKEAEKTRYLIDQLEKLERVEHGVLFTPPTTDSQAQQPLWMKIKEVFQTHGLRMHRKDVLQALREQGVVIGGKRPINIVSAHLSHHPKVFRCLGEGNWELIG